MQALTQHTGIVAPLEAMNVDTDQIIPKQFLKRIERTGYGDVLFYDWRYLDDGKTPNPDFELNQERYAGASILLAQDNFGCGSSREHAVWALTDFGFRAVIAPSFADIFFNNSFKNGLLPIVLSEKIVDDLFKLAVGKPGYQLTVDLEAQLVRREDGTEHPFEVDPFRRECLLKGLDDIALTLQHADEIRAYEARRRQETPWLFSQY